MNVKQLGEAAVASGWRKKAADSLAPRIARSPLPVGRRGARALVGVALLATTLKYLADTAARARRA